MGISFEQSGRGPLQFGLPEVSELAVQHGFVKKDAPPHAPPASRADLAAFFKAFDCNALSSFRKRFCEQPLEPVRAAALKEATAATAPARVTVRAAPCRLCLSTFRRHTLTALRAAAPARPARSP
jgi:hypothetical protein